MRAYKRFEKHFDSKHFNYYYRDVRTRKSSWKKPWALGKFEYDYVYVSFVVVVNNVI